MSETLEKLLKEHKMNFDENGICKSTKKKYNKYGLDCNMFNKNGIFYFNREKYDFLGYDVNRFNKEFIHEITSTKYDENGYDVNKINCHGFYDTGINIVTKKMYNEHGIDIRGFNSFGIHIVTKNEYDLEGFNFVGINKDGFNRDKIHNITNSKYDLDGNNFYGFNEYNIHKETNTQYNENGFDSNLICHYTSSIYDAYGFDVDGFNENNFSYNSYHKNTFTKYDLEGYDINGIDSNGWFRNKTSAVTHNIYDENKFDINGIHLLTKKDYNENLLDKNGVHIVTKIQYEKNQFDGPFYKETIENLIVSELSLAEFIKENKIDVKIMKKFMEIAINDSKYAKFITKIKHDSAERYINKSIDEANEFVENGNDLWSLLPREQLEKLVNITLVDKRIVEIIQEYINNNDDSFIRPLLRYYSLEYKNFSPGALMILDRKLTATIVEIKNKYGLVIPKTFIGVLKSKINAHKTAYSSLVDVNLIKDDQKYTVTKEDEELGLKYTRLKGEYPSAKSFNNNIKEFTYGTLTKQDVIVLEEEQKLRMKKIHEDKIKVKRTNNVSYKQR